MKRVFLHAPNIHAGGGLVLLSTFFAATNAQADFEQFDIRAADLLPPSKGIRRWVRPTLISRVLADLYLWRNVTPADIVVCFHGLMPLFPLGCEVRLFLQNRIIISDEDLSSYSVKARIRLKLERFILRMSARRAKRVVVQTPSMAVLAASALKLCPSNIVICPFVGDTVRSPYSLEKCFDFVYVASDDPHKNHTRLLDAWCQLASEGIRPHLAFTLPDDSQLMRKVRELRQRYNLMITNVGVKQVEEIAALYAQSRALIYPSMTESFGLPLLEAQGHGLPVLAGELDYVRDIIEPSETFDPTSALSISRAVKRFLGVRVGVQQIFSADAFWKDMTQ